MTESARHPKHARPRLTPQANGYACFLSDHSAPTPPSCVRPPPAPHPLVPIPPNAQSPKTQKNIAASNFLAGLRFLESSPRECSLLAVGALGVEELRVRDGIAETLKLIELPHHGLTLWINLNNERLAGASVAVTDDVIAIFKDLQSGDPCKPSRSEVVLAELPHDLLFWCHFEDAVTVAGCDKRVSILEANSTEAFSTE